MNCLIERLLFSTRTNVTEKDDVMQEEIFGPLLPFITVNNEQEAIRFMNSRDKPLALYVFSDNKDLAKRIIDATSSGSTCVNDVIFQVAPLSLPFGGVGASGLGAYHGKYSFDAFSHRRPVVYAPTWTESMTSIRNPPYNPQTLAFMEKMGKINRRSLPLPQFLYAIWDFLLLLFALIINKFTGDTKKDK